MTGSAGRWGADVSSAGWPLLERPGWRERRRDPTLAKLPNPAAGACLGAGLGASLHKGAEEATTGR